MANLVVDNYKSLPFKMTKGALELASAAELLLNDSVSNTESLDKVSKFSAAFFENAADALDAINSPVQAVTCRVIVKGWKVVEFVCSSTNFINRVNELLHRELWCGKSDHVQCSKKLFSRIFLSVGHSIDFVKGLDRWELIDLAKWCDNVGGALVTTVPLRIVKDVAIVIASSLTIWHNTSEMKAAKSCAYKKGAQDLTIEQVQAHVNKWSERTVANFKNAPHKNEAADKITGTDLKFNEYLVYKQTKWENIQFNADKKINKLTWAIRFDVSKIAIIAMVLTALKVGFTLIVPYSPLMFAGGFMLETVIKRFGLLVNTFGLIKQFVEITPNKNVETLTRPALV